MVDIAELQQRARALTLGPQFKPRELNIDTPQLLLDKLPELKDQLKLVGMSASELMQWSDASGPDKALNVALLICQCLRFRDAGGPDGRGTPYFAMSDAPTLVTQDYALQKELGAIVQRFLGLLPSPAETVEDAKNASGATSNTATGSESPPASLAPSANASDDLSTANSLNGSPS